MTDAQIQVLINNLPIGVKNGVSAAKLKQIFQALKDRVVFSGSYTDLSNRPNLFSGSYNDLANKPQLFSKQYSDLEGIPETIEHSNKFRARTFLFSEQEEKLIQNDTIWHSGAQILAHRPTTMNVIIHPSQLKNNFETFIDQIGEGPVNLVNAEQGDYEFMLPDGKLAQTENRMDSISILIWKTKIIVKGDLKDA
ncbi:MAG: hypothetical protein ACPGSD_07675 [Flavobacteriales bacterium]